MNTITKLIAGIVLSVSLAIPAPAQDLTEAEIDQLAREAYVYAFPMVENYLSIYQFALDPQSSQYKGSPNAIHNVDRVFTPADTGVVTPNSDTPYSFFVMDLRTEPLVVTLPEIEDDRYYSLQIVDLYSHNVDYIGTRKDGNSGGDFLIAGPGWKGEVPEGITRSVLIPTEIVYSQFRTQLFHPSDIDRVREIQLGYRVQPLSEYTGTDAPQSAPEIDWPEISRETAQPMFWDYANFLLQFAPPLPWEAQLRENFARIGMEAGAPWPPENLDPDAVAAITTKGDETLANLQARVLALTSSRGLFGSPEEMRGKYLERALGALGGLYGLQEEEALYVTYLVDPSGQQYNASETRYRMIIPGDDLPPAGSFWSLTMYDGNRFLVENPIDRYLINSAMLAELERDEAGDIVIRIQHDSPGSGMESNWLPAPDGPFGMVMRLYLPDVTALSGQWIPPALEAVD